MFNKYKFALVMAMLSLLGCSRQSSLLPLAGASIENQKTLVRLREGSLQLRGLDGKALDISKIPNAFSDFVFVVTPGMHTLWGINIPGGHPLAPEGLRCYTIPDVNLEAGVTYRLEENQDRMVALIKREDTGAEIATGKIVDRKAAFTENCKWE